MTAHPSLPVARLSWKAPYFGLQKLVERVLQFSHVLCACWHQPIRPDGPSSRSSLQEEITLTTLHLPRSSNGEGKDAGNYQDLAPQPPLKVKVSYFCAGVTPLEGDFYYSKKQPPIQWKVRNMHHRLMRARDMDDPAISWDGSVDQTWYGTEYFNALWT